MNDSYYDGIASGYDQLHGEEQQKKFLLIKERFLSHIDVEDIGRALDVGCGTAPYAAMIGFPVEGIDPSAGLLRRCPYRKKRVGNAEALPYPDHAFDLVFSLTAIQNFADIEKGLREMRRVGKEMFILSYLKRSEKAERIKQSIGQLFTVEERLEEDKDIILLCR